MPFPEAVRRWALRIAGNKCQTLVYTERSGYRICGSTRSLHVDHLDPENFVRTNGGDPNNDSIPFVRCKDHHVGHGLVVDGRETRFAHYGEKEWSRHADVGVARIRYTRGDKDAIKRALDRHHERAVREDKYWNSDDGVDISERSHAEHLIWRAHLDGDNRPKVKPHRHIGKRKKWYDIFFE